MCKNHKEDCSAFARERLVMWVRCLQMTLKCGKKVHFKLAIFCPLEQKKMSALI